MSRLKKNDGFTIIEVMIAMGIFAIGFLAVAAMQIDANMKTYSARDITEAMELATAQVELLHGLPLYDDTLDLGGTVGVVEQFDMPPELENGNHEIPIGFYTIQWTVTPNIPLPAIPNIYSTTGPDPLTISKTVMVRAFETRNPNRILAQFEMVKIWDKDG